MRGLLVTLIVLAAAAVGADRVAYAMATDRAEQRLSDHGVQRPEVEVGGFPFLTQLAAREFSTVRVAGVVPYERVEARSGVDGLVLSGAGHRVRMRGTATVLGQRVPVSVLARVRTHPRAISLVPDAVQLDGGTGAVPIPDSVRAALRHRFSFTYRVGDELPASLRLVEVTPAAAGFAVEVSGTGVALADLR